MDDSFKDPHSITPASGAPQIKLDFKGTLAAIVRTAMDGLKGSPSAGTFAEWIKAAGLETDIETQAFQLVARSLIGAFRAQLRQRITDTRLDENNNLVYADTELRFEVFDGLDSNGYTLHLANFSNPQAFPLLDDFKPCYEDWLAEHFPISAEVAQDLAADFPDFFGYQFYHELRTEPDRYADLLARRHDPLAAETAQLLARRTYQAELRGKYQMPALGEADVLLSNVYVEPDFLVYERILPKEKIGQVLAESGEEGRFRRVDFSGSLHTYLLQHFLPAKKSGAIGREVERSRVLILLGQPGHGKSSFCYRSIFDLKKAGLRCKAFFVRLQKAGRRILDDPLSEIEDLLPDGLGFEDWTADKHDEPSVFFLDGLDEFCMTKSLSDEEVLRFLGNIKRLAQRHETLRFVITSRFNYVDTAKLFNGDCLLFSLGKLSERQQGELVQKFADRRKNETLNLNTDLLEKINKDHDLKHVRELIELPILLQMVLLSGVEIGQAKSRAEVYDNLFDTVLARKWDKAGPLDKYLKDERFQPKHLRAYLAFLAFKIFQNRRGYLEKSEIVGYGETQDFAARHLSLENEGTPLRDVLKDVLTSFYLKEASAASEDEYAVEFLHKSLYEYLACEHLWAEACLFFTEKDARYGDLKKRRFEEVQRKVQELFGNTRLTDETVGHLKEIIAKHPEKQAELAPPMAEHLPALLRRGFLHAWPVPGSAAGYLPEQQVLHAFHGYWLILGQLNLHRVDWDGFLKKDWAELRQLPAFREGQMEMEQAYHQHLEVLKTAPSWRRRDEAFYDGERVAFSEWLAEGAEGHPDFERWVWNYLLRQHGRQCLKAQYRAVGQVAKPFARLLRTVAAERLPMKLSGLFLSLEKADLGGLRAWGIDMRGADLRNADLRNADLRNADLRNADLRNADLRNADLRNARVTEADWLKNLASRGVLGAEELQACYRVSAEKRGFSNRFGIEYEAYVLLKK